MSSRNFILQGPQEDEEPESEYTISELKEMKVKEQQAAEAAEKQRILMEALEQEKKKKKEEEDGIDWGMGKLLIKIKIIISRLILTFFLCLNFLYFCIIFFCFFINVVLIILKLYIPHFYCFCGVKKLPFILHYYFR